VLREGMPRRLGMMGMGGGGGDGISDQGNETAKRINKS